MKSLMKNCQNGGWLSSAVLGEIESEDVNAGGT